MNKEYCMKNRCNGCKNYDYCFEYKKKRKNNKKLKNNSIFDKKRQNNK